MINSCPRCTNPLPKNHSGPCPTCGPQPGRPPALVQARTGPVQHLVEELRALINEKGVSRAHLAETIYCSPATLSRDLSGRRCPTWEQVEAIIRACDDEKHLAIWQQRWRDAQLSLIDARLYPGPEAACSNSGAASFLPAMILVLVLIATIVYYMTQTF
ncbi:MAG: helix-turn-helix domain-containing protein [Streptomyces sp.]|jgi:lambda repressor-like predicted transcriptional regulator|nr:helix-turn-helix domain-containing protein [Streptomyces sp.]